MRKTCVLCITLWPQFMFAIPVSTSSCLQVPTCPLSSPSSSSSSSSSLQPLYHHHLHHCRRCNRKRAMMTLSILVGALFTHILLAWPFPCSSSFPKNLTICIRHDHHHIWQKYQRRWVNHILISKPMNSLVSNNHGTVPGIKEVGGSFNIAVICRCVYCTNLPGCTPSTKGGEASKM